MIFLLSNSELNLLCKWVHISFFEKDNVICRRLQSTSDLRLTSKFLTEKQKICICRFLFKLRSKKVYLSFLFPMSCFELCSMNELRGINWFFRYRWYRIWMVTQETCVLLVELPTGNINAVLLLDEGNLL